MGVDKIVVLLATYNGEKYVKEQIDSVLNQSNVRVNIVVADDNSKDQTVDVIKHNFSALPVKINQPSTGSAACNFLQMLKDLSLDDSFDYIALCDQDDLWLPKKLETAVARLKTESADLYASNMIKWDTEKESYSTLKKDDPQQSFDYLFEGASAGCTYVLSKSLAKEVVTMYSKVPNVKAWCEFSHDWFIYFVARYKNYKVYIDNQSFIHYRLHADNVHGNLNKLSFKAFSQKVKKVFGGYHIQHAENYIKLIDHNSEAYKIYSYFIGGYFKRNYIIWKYNRNLMRNPKKLAVFMILNILKFK